MQRGSTSEVGESVSGPERAEETVARHPGMSLLDKFATNLGGIVFPNFDL
jgi:hypothetical protein